MFTRSSAPRPLAVNGLRALAGTGAILLIGIAGCAKTPPTVAPSPSAIASEAPPAPPLPATPPAAIASAERPRSLSDEELFARMSLDELNGTRPLADIFFDLDQYTLRDDARQALQRNADWLRRWSSVRIVVEGHGDSRGTSEYNLALAERRAQAVKAYLAALGVNADRVLTVSRGEESPVCHEEHEGCWSQNRRAHHLIAAK